MNEVELGNSDQPLATGGKWQVADSIPEQERAYLTDAVIGWAVGVVVTAVCWQWFLGAWAKRGLEVMGVL
jgi:hypothetical protein